MMCPQGVKTAFCGEEKQIGQVYEANGGPLGVALGFGVGGADDDMLAGS